ncbi:T9SS type A sorting domain-containing protein [Patiriisocius sp. Uisw_017]|uniref:T9SS type A sorting domain-containing protein n=1 Tax=Patiriisocius sp. Uisw_017 TaxID=3230968 RepID=UPI0039E7FD96
MKKAALIFILLFFGQSFSQSDPFCFGISSILQFGNNSNLPQVSDNGDGTITLIFSEQYITDLFAEYGIYAFEQFSGNRYRMESNSKNLLIAIEDQVPSSQIEVDNDYLPSGPIQQEFLDFVDGKTFDLIGTEEYDEDQVINCYNGPMICDPLDQVPENFNFQVAINYDSQNDLLLFETVSTTSCESSFSFSMRRSASTDFEKELQIWSIDSAVSNMLDGACGLIEFRTYLVMQLLCDNNFDYGGFGSQYYFPDELGVFRLRKGTPLMGEFLVDFRDTELSIEENNLSEVLIYEKTGSPYLQLKNPQDKELSIVIFDLTGKNVLSKTSFKNNTLNIGVLQSNAIYLLHVKTTKGDSKVFKLLKR